MNVIQGAILGVIQGLGEFLPISSSGHLILVRSLMGISSEDPAFRIFDILLHVGTLLPVLVIFWRDWIDMICHPIRNKTLLMLFLASLPTLGFYLLFDMDGFENGWFLGPSFLITSVFLLITELVSTHRSKPGRQKAGVIHALCMGVMQGCGLLPGVSRSGSTITGGVLAGLDRKAAASFSFMMSAPAIGASLLVEGKHALEEGLFSHLSLVPTVVGVLCAAIVGFLAIRLMLDMISRVSLCWFALYTAILGLAVLLLQLCGSGMVPAFSPEAVSAVLMHLPAA